MSKRCAGDGVGDLVLMRALVNAPALCPPPAGVERPPCSASPVAAACPAGTEAGGRAPGPLWLARAWGGAGLGACASASAIRVSRASS